MPVTNATVSSLLRRYAAVLTLEGANRFRVKAYRKAAGTVDALQTSVATLVERGENLEELPGIGKAMSALIAEIVKTGKLSSLERSVSRLEPALVELAEKPALDPAKVRRIYKKLKINSLAKLKEHLDSGKIRELFGARMDYHVRQGFDERPRLLLYSAEPLAQRIEEQLRRLPNVSHVSRTGSLRRKQETVGDLNFLVSGKNAASIFKKFAELPSVESSELRGKRAALFRLSSGVSASLTWCPPGEWGLALVLATGSSAHLEDLQAHAAKHRLTPSSRSLKAKHIDIANESAVYRALKLPFVEPELREGRGEVAAAAENSLPQLVTAQNLRGDLHMHTTASDGANTLPEMAAAAEARGYEYIAITDHSQSLRITNGLTEQRLYDQIEQIDRFNARNKALVVLKSAEVDILEDGRLDYSNAVLKELDFTICSIHSRFALSKEQQTTRILRAMDNPYFNILGHATGRLLLKREGYELDFERILDHARSRGCHFEINSSPDRLDLSDEHAKLARELGVKIAVNTDAHSVRELNFISAGINQARRAWLEPADVLNSHPLNQLQKLLRR